MQNKLSKFINMYYPMIYDKVNPKSSTVLFNCPLIALTYLVLPKHQVELMNNT